MSEPAYIRIVSRDGKSVGCAGVQRVVVADAFHPHHKHQDLPDTEPLVFIVCFCRTRSWPSSNKLRDGAEPNTPLLVDYCGRRMVESSFAGGNQAFTPRMYFHSFRSLWMMGCAL